MFGKYAIAWLSAIFAASCVSLPSEAIAPEILGGEGDLAQRPNAKYVVSGRYFCSGPEAFTLAIGGQLVEVLQVPAATNVPFAFETLLAEGDAYTVGTADKTCQIGGASGTQQGNAITDVTVRCGTAYAFANGTAASAVLGQPNLTSSDPNETASTFNTPRAVVRQPPSHVLVADTNNNRIEVFLVESGNSVATVAGLSIGQPGSTASTPGTTAATMRGPTGLASDGSVLVTADTLNNRVLIFRPLPSVGLQNAAVVLGQADFTSSAAACSPTGMSQPLSVASVGGAVLVSDTANNRVLIWTSAPATSGVAPQLVLGQSQLDACTAQPTSASSLLAPQGLWTDGQVVVVADTGNNRVLIWNTFPTTSGQPADIVVGQPDMTSVAAGTSAGALSGPVGVYSNYVRLFVADTGNSRVLMWSALPQQSGMPATAVLGQPDFTSSAPSVSATGMVAPSGMADLGTTLLVCDTGANRVTVYNSN